MDELKLQIMSKQNRKSELTWIEKDKMATDEHAKILREFKANENVGENHAIYGLSGQFVRYLIVRGIDLGIESEKNSK